MGISLKQLEEERVALQFTFDQLTMKIKKVENETQSMRNNLNAVHGALQQVDKLIKVDMLHGDSTGRKDDENQPSAASIDIKEKEQVRLLQEERAKEAKEDGNEGDK
jgi:hypothetical protein